MEWKKYKSVAKARQVAPGAAAGAAGLGGVVAALLIALRAAKTDLLPWNVEADAAIVAFIGTLGGYIGGFWKRYRDDKIKYTNGDDVKEAEE